MRGLCVWGEVAVPSLVGREPSLALIDTRPDQIMKRCGAEGSQAPWSGSPRINLLHQSGASNSLEIAWGLGPRGNGTGRKVEWIGNDSQ